MAGLRIDFSTKSGIVTAAGVGILIIGTLVQIIQTGHPPKVGFNTINLSAATAVILAVGFVVIIIGVLWGLFGEKR